MLTRRSLLTGLVALVAAPAIVRASSIMPVRVMVLAPRDWMHIPGTAMAIKASPECISWWEEVFKLKDAAVPYEHLPVYDKALRGGWEYIVSPNYVKEKT